MQCCCIVVGSTNIILKLIANISYSSAVIVSTLFLVEVQSQLCFDYHVIARILALIDFSGCQPNRFGSISAVEVWLGLSDTAVITRFQIGRIIFGNHRIAGIELPYLGPVRIYIVLSGLQTRATGAHEIRRITWLFIYVCLLLNSGRAFAPCDSSQPVLSTVNVYRIAA